MTLTSAGSAWTHTRALAGSRWLGPLAVAALFVAMGIWSWRTWPDPVVDFGQQLYVSWRLVEGDALYRDVAYLYGPLSPWLNAVLFLAFGTGLMTLVLANFVVTAGVAALLYIILVAIGSRLSAAVAGATFVTVFAFGQIVPYGNYNFICPYVYGVTHGIALSLLGIYGLGLYHRRPGALPAAGIGLILGLIFLTKAEVFLAGGAALLLGFALTLWLERPPLTRTIRLAGAFAGCALVPPLIGLAVLSARMPLAEAIRGLTGTWPIILGRKVEHIPMYQWSMGLDDFGSSLHYLLKSIAWYGMLLGVPALLGLAVRKHGRHRPWLTAATLVAVASFLMMWQIAWPWTIDALPLFMLALGASAAAGLAGRRGLDPETSRRVLELTMLLFATVLMAKILFFVRTFHYGFALAMPATLLAVVALFDWIPARIDRAGGHSGPLRAAALVVWCAFVLGHLALTHEQFERKTETVAAGRDAFRADWRGRFVNDMLLEIEKRAGPDATVAALPAGVMINYLSRRASSVPYVYFMPSDFVMYGEDRMLARFRTTPPDFIVLVHKDTGEYGAKFFGRDYGQALHDWIRQNYRTVARLGAPPLQDERFGMELLVAEGISLDRLALSDRRADPKMSVIR